MWLAYLIAIGRPINDPWRYMQAHCYSAKKTPISIQDRPGEKGSYIYTRRGGWAKKCNAFEGDSERDESTEEQLQCKKQYLCTSHGTLSLASLSL